MACREYTLPREKTESQPNGSIQGNTELVPVLEVATNSLHGKHRVNVRIMFLSKDNTHSWVRISHEPNKIVINAKKNRRICFITECKDFAC